jgi:predicted ATPase/class 3 adenylate cyclase
MRRQRGPQPDRSERSRATLGGGAGTRRHESHPQLPSGTVTFLFTDIEGSSRLWERCPDAMRLALIRHEDLLRSAIERHNGYVFKTVGDAFCAAFPTALDALNAAIAIHLTLLDEPWGETGPIQVRIGLHTGAAEERDNDYFGPTLNRVARLHGIGHGQQTLLSQATYELVQDSLPADLHPGDLGMHRLRDLATPEHVWHLTHPSLPQEFPPLKSLDYLPTNLPAQITSFIGREKEMEEIKTLMQKTRLLTLTGSGGCGKTRLALQVAAEILEQYADGVWLVELAALSDPSLVAQTVAEGLRIREVPSEPITQTLLSYLKDKQMLLVLDNCEHLLDTTARLVDAVLKSCSQVSVLASSREALGVGGESAYRVPSLSVPDLKQTHTPRSLSDYDSVRLFLERAVPAKSDFAVTPHNAAAVASVCRRLDGIPLAIELAAVRVRAMPVEQIEARLDSRFRLLVGGLRTALPRQQTLRALIDWSYDLLNPQEQRLLCRLSVFADGWTLEAAETVCSGAGIEQWEALDLLTSLVDKSLTVYEEREGKPRYRLLETVRQYGGDLLVESGENGEVWTRHRDYYLAFAEEAQAKLSGAEPAVWLQRLEEEHENLRAALAWSLSANGAVEGLRLCGALQQFWWTRQYLAEGRKWCERALGKAGSEPPTPERAQVLNGAAGLAYVQGDYAAARAYNEASLAIRREIGDTWGIAASLNNLGLVAFDLGDFAAARTAYEESLAILREMGDRKSIAALLNNLGLVTAGQGDYTFSWVCQEESLTIRRETGDRTGISQSLMCLGMLAFGRGDYASARASQEESLAIQRDIGDKKMMAFSLTSLGMVAASENRDFSSARANLAEGLMIRKEIGNRRDIAYSLRAFAWLASKESNPGRATSLWGAEERVREEIGALLAPGEHEEYDRLVADVRLTLGEEAFSAARAAGYAMTLEEAVALALEGTDA